MKLSICIPTYNRRNELVKLIKSIEEAINEFQVAPSLEVIVCDNASDDGTEIEMNYVISKLKYVRYTRNICNQGFAANLNKTIELARGDYCWLLGSDDVILPGALIFLLEQVESKSDIFVGNPVTNLYERKFFSFDGSMDFFIKSHDDLSCYLSQCTEISAAFAFISTLVIKRHFWNESKCTCYELTHPYTHMLRLLRGCNSSGGIIRALNETLVETGNSGNEFNATILPHFELDLLTIKHVLDAIYTDSPLLLESYGEVFRRQYNPILLIKARIECEKERWDNLLPMLILFKYPRWLLRKSSFDVLLFKLYMTVKIFRARLKK